MNKRNKNTQIHKHPEKITRLEAFNRFISFSCYVGKVKIHLDTQGGSAYRFGCTYYPTDKQFEFNLGECLLNFWYRKDMI